MELIAADYLLRDVHEFVVQQHHVVAVPTDGTADVKQQAGAEQQHGRDLFRDHLSWMIVARVQAKELLPRDRGSRVEPGRSRRVAFRADAEQLRLDRVEMNRGIDRFRENTVERIDQSLT